MSEDVADFLCVDFGHLVVHQAVLVEHFTGRGLRTS